MHISKLALCFFVAELLAYPLAGCAKEPSNSDIAASLVRMDGRYNVVSVKVEASENIGSKVEPVVRQRFTASVVGKGIFYSVVPNEDYWHKKWGITVVVPAGYPYSKSVPPKDTLYGIATSRLVEEHWVTTTELSNIEGDPILESHEMASPLSQFLGKVYVKDSDEFNKDILPKENAWESHVASVFKTFDTVGSITAGTMSPQDEGTARRMQMKDNDSIPLSFNVQTADPDGHYEGTVSYGNGAHGTLTGIVSISGQYISIRWLDSRHVKDWSPPYCNGELHAADADSYVGQVTCPTFGGPDNVFILALKPATH